MLLCGAVQPGRGVEPKHNVPRLKLSYKGKPILQSPLSPEYIWDRGCCWCFECSLSSLFCYARGCSFMLFFSCILFLTLNIPFFSLLFTWIFSSLCVSLFHSFSLLVSTQHLTLWLPVFIPLSPVNSLLPSHSPPSVSQNPVFFLQIVRLVPYAQEMLLPGVKCIYWPLYQFSSCAVRFCWYCAPLLSASNGHRSLGFNGFCPKNSAFGHDTEPFFKGPLLITVS